MNFLNKKILKSLAKSHTNIKECSCYNTEGNYLQASIQHNAIFNDQDNIQEITTREQKENLCGRLRHVKAKLQHTVLHRAKLKQQGLSIDNNSNSCSSRRKARNRVKIMITKNHFSGSSLACPIELQSPQFPLLHSGRPERVSHVCLRMNPLSLLNLVRLGVPPGWSTTAAWMPAPGRIPLPNHLWSRSGLGSGHASAQLFCPFRVLTGDQSEECSVCPLNPHIFPRNFTETLFVLFIIAASNEICIICRSWAQMTGAGLGPSARTDKGCTEITIHFITNSMSSMQGQSCNSLLSP